jgi:hypothetical protein
MAKRKTKISKGMDVKVTGRSPGYIQHVSKSGKIGKAEPVIITTVAGTGAVRGAPKAPRRTRKSPTRNASGRFIKRS